MVNVQFADSTDAAVISYFGSPQNPSVYSNLGEIDPSDPRWKTYYDQQTSSVQAALPAPISA
ncbi:hypothetical protein [Burkholderia ubonensis]|uniref:hypothetical protein n=1 Tax=Burkholderia ubonensis TaxID=101571 RepID=UPI000AA49BF4|nr:hypothetical protein [Burkholderia ubonensis]